MPARIRFACALVVLIGLTPVAGRAQIPNAGFENWTSGNPDNWAANNAAPVLVPITQSAVAHSGSSAVKGTVISYFTLTLQPLLQAGPLGRGFAYASRPTAFTGWYQFHSVVGDRLSISNTLFLGGVAGSVIGIATSANATEVSSWTQFSLPFLYESPSSPDTSIIQIQILGPTGSDFHAGSYFIVDDLGFGSGSSDVPGASRPLVTEFADSGPNPFVRSTSIAFTLAAPGAVTLAIYDLQGRAVATLLDGRFDAGLHAVAWDAKQLPGGVYLARLRAGGVERTRKLVRMR